MRRNPHCAQDELGEGQKNIKTHFNKTKSKVGLHIQKENSCISEVMKNPLTQKINFTDFFEPKSEDLVGLAQEQYSRE